VFVCWTASPVSIAAVEVNEGAVIPVNFTFTGAGAVASGVHLDGVRFFAGTS
jgi:hypothetical protein